MFLHLAVAWAMAAALITPWLASRPPQRRGYPRLSVITAFAPLVLNLLILWNIPVVSRNSGAHLMLVLAAMGVYASQALVFVYWRSKRGERIHRVLWIVCSSLAQGFFTGEVARLLAEYYADKYTLFHIESPLSVLQLQMMLLIGFLTAGLLMTVAAAGTVEGIRADEILIHEEIDCSGFAERDQDWIGRMRLLAEWFVVALLARSGAVAFSLLLGAFTNPISPKHYLEISLGPSSSLLLARVVIGLILPLIYAFLALQTLRGHAPRDAGRQFFPAFVMIVLTEIFAAALTAGNWGVAF